MELKKLIKMIGDKETIEKLSGDVTKAARSGDMDRVSQLISEMDEKQRDTELDLHNDLLLIQKQIEILRARRLDIKEVQIVIALANLKPAEAARLTCEKLEIEEPDPDLLIRKLRHARGESYAKWISSGLDIDFNLSLELANIEISKARTQEQREDVELFIVRINEAELAFSN